VNPAERQKKLFLGREVLKARRTRSHLQGTIGKLSLRNHDLSYKVDGQNLKNIDIATFTGEIERNGEKKIVPLNKTN